MTEPAASPALAELLAAAEPAEPRRLDGLIARLRDADLVRGARRDDLPIGAAALGDVEIRGVTDDSRAVREGTLFAALPGFHVDGHEYVASAAAAGAAAAIVEHPVGGVDLPQLVVGASRAALARAAGWWYGDPSRTLGIDRDHRHGRQDHDLVPRRRRAGGGGPLDRPDRDGRDQGRPAPRPARRARDHARGARAAGDARGDGPRRQRGGGDRDHVPRPRARPGPGRRLGRRRVHQPHPRAPRAPRHVRGVPRRQAPAVPRLASAPGSPTPRTAGDEPAQGRRRASVAQGRDRQPRRPRGVVVRGRRPRGRRHGRHLRHGPGRPRPRHRRSRRTPAGFASPTRRRRGRAGSSCAWPAASTSTTRWRSSRSARRSASTPRRSATGSRRSRACRAGWSGSTRASRSR